VCTVCSNTLSLNTENLCLPRVTCCFVSVSCSTACIFEGSWLHKQWQMLQTGRERCLGLLFCLVKAGKIGKTLSIIY